MRSLTVPVRQYLKKSAASKESSRPALNLLKARPFAPQRKPTLTAESIQASTQLHRAARAGYRLSQLAISSSSGSPSQHLQAKMAIGAPGDKYEQEADRVAQQVVNRIQSSTLHQSPAGNAVQRADALEEEDLQMKSLVDSIQRADALEEEELQMKPLDDSIQRVEGLEEEELQMKPLADSIQRADALEEEELQMKPHQQRQLGPMDASSDLEQAISQARGKGQALDDCVRQPMEQAFGTDFSHVRVHTGGQSDQLNRAIQAKAFTTGQDIFFSQGAYAPTSRGGQELLAHELTHVIQQAGGVRRATAPEAIQRWPFGKKKSEEEQPLLGNNPDYSDETLDEEETGTSKVQVLKEFGQKLMQYKIIHDKYQQYKEYIEPKALTILNTVWKYVNKALSLCSNLDPSGITAAVAAVSKLVKTIAGYVTEAFTLIKNSELVQELTPLLSKDLTFGAVKDAFKEMKSLYELGKDAVDTVSELV